MAPNQSNIQDSERIKNQVLRLIDAIDYKTLTALYELYDNRIREENRKHEKCPKGDFGAVVARDNAIMERRVIALLIHFKRNRDEIKREFLENKYPT